MNREDEILMIWGLNTEDLKTVANKLPLGRLKSSLVTMHTYLRYLFPQVEVRNNWMRKPNGAFGGKRPIDLILEDGELGLDVVEKYLAGAMQR